MCVPPALAGAVDCGRKKLPFAGYSVVKEPVEAMSHQPMERRSRGELLSKLYFGSRVRETTNRLRKFRAPELAILTSLGTNPQARPANSMPWGDESRSRSEERRVGKECRSRGSSCR